MTNMKNIAKWILPLLLLAINWSCTKEETKIYYEGGTAPVLSSSVTGDSLALAASDSTKSAITLTWTNPDYKFTTGVSSHSVNYLLEMDTVGANFGSSKKVSVPMGSSLGTSYTVGELNDILVNKLKLDAGKWYAVEMHVIADIDGIEATKLTSSNKLSYKILTYETVTPIYYLHVPGSYQGWAPDVAPILGSFDAENYEGYVNFPDAATDFKFTSQPGWGGTNYGDGGTKKLSTDGGAGNLHVDGVGYYLLKADITALSWSYTKTTWGVVGDATAGGWDNSTPMTYDAASRTWVAASVYLTSGKSFKFRANNAWDINLGDDPATDYLKYNGDNFSVPSGDGNYKIELNLSTSPQYTYTITKL